jgi:TonB family protein
MRLLSFLISLVACLAQSAAQYIPSWAVSRVVSMEYPQLAIQARIQGRLTVECTLNKNGTVSTAQIVDSDSMTQQAMLLLGQAVLENVRQWRFRKHAQDREQSSTIRIHDTFAFQDIPSSKRTTRFIFDFPDLVYVITSYMSL